MSGKVDEFQFLLISDLSFPRLREIVINSNIFKYRNNFWDLNDRKRNFASRVCQKIRLKFKLVAKRTGAIKL